MAREFWPGERPIGKRFKEVFLEEWTTVVGVVRDVRHQGLATAAEAEAYWPLRQLPVRDAYLVVRTSYEPTRLAQSLRESVASVDPTVPVSEIRTGEQLVSNSVASPRFTAVLLTAVAGLALILAAVGIYGLLSYVVSRQTREIGVRMAMGASGIGILSRVFRRELLLASAGTVLGIVGAMGATRLLQSLLFGVSTTDPVTFVAVPVQIAAVALVAAYNPARRATRVDPLVVLRWE
jgi:putative ABC transport system permease protein